MTPDEMNNIIAEWCEPKPSQDIGRKITLYDWESPGGFWICSVPAPGHLTPWKPKELSECRNLMARAEQVVRERGLWKEYAHQLLRIVSGIDYDASRDQLWLVTSAELFAIATATAPQRAEAMVRMIKSQEGE